MAPDQITQITYGIDWTIVLRGLGTTVAIIGTNVALFSWIRSYMRSFESEIRGWKGEIDKQMKDFHGRLCSTEAKEKKMNPYDSKDPYFRHQSDVWYFGIMLTTGKILVIECVLSVLDEYIQVKMKTRDEAIQLAKLYGNNPNDYIGSFCERETAMVRKEHIVMIFELADT